ncbi:aldehyde dehydrogenase family protein [Prauserella cavernicola]|uniref:Aldehyde dehydrogenase family protein n=1 Tax=Prauserella cavernicola TaxID=2800127 RepID=A0A934QY75_9PSEU|nr:aldehyde dehydrogenase family protein [Prauserella cavernicola]MBK1788327.1 aldehyde dehydrogenase family protein [Prauserella cavernicola]
MTVSVEPAAGTVAPEAFRAGRPLNFWGGLWRADGVPELEAADAARAVRAGLNEHRTWTLAPLTERRLRVDATLDDLAAHRELLDRLAGGGGFADGLAETRECAERIEGLIAGRDPLRGPVSNIAEAQCPAATLVHAMLVQVLAGNAAIVKATEPAGPALAIATALAARHGLPFTLLHGGGEGVDAALSRPDVVGCVSYPDGTRRGVSLVAAVTRRARA